MNELALLAIGCGFGISLAVVSVLVYSLWHTASSISRQSAVALKKTDDQLAANRLALQQLQNQLSVSLQKLDAERLYHASQKLQSLVKSLTIQVDTMQKAVFAQPAGPAIDFTAGGLDDEAEDDARLIDERNNRWAPPASQPLPNIVRSYGDDSLAGLSEEEKTRRIQQYFEQRRRTSTQAIVGAGWSDYLNPPSAPPTAGSGVYRSLLDEANQRPVPQPAPPDFSGTELDSEVDLVGKGELE